MTRCQRLVLAVMLALLLAAPGASPVAGEADEQAARLQQLRERIAKLKVELGDMRGREAVLQRELESTEKAIGRTASGMWQLEQEKAASQTRLEELERERGQQLSTLQQMRVLLAQDLRSAYLMGQQEQVKLRLLGIAHRLAAHVQRRQRQESSRSVQGP